MMVYRIMYLGFEPKWIGPLSRIWKPGVIKGREKNILMCAVSIYYIGNKQPPCLDFMDRRR